MGSTYYNGQKVEAAYYNGSATTAYCNGEKLWPVNDVFTVTLLTSVGGTISADKLTGHAGDLITVKAINDDYYRFYSLAATGTDGVIDDTAFRLTGDCTASATFMENIFTAWGTFATEATARYGWFMPALVTSVSIPYGNGSDVSSYRAYQYKLRTGANAEVSKSVNMNGLWGTFSACSGAISQTGSSYRRASYGNFNYSMRHGGKAYTYNSTGAGSYSAGRWKATQKSTTFAWDTWTVGTAIGAGDGNTLHIDAWYAHTSIYTVTKGSWHITGIAK